MVNVGRLSEYAVAGRFGAEPGKDPLTINSEVLRSAGLISNDRLPVKVLGHGDVTVKLFVAADAFTKSAREKIEAAGGFVQATAVIIPKGETKQDRADARAVIANEKQKASDAADAARWAAAPRPTSAAPAAAAAARRSRCKAAPAEGRAAAAESRAKRPSRRGDRPRRGRTRAVDAAPGRSSREATPADAGSTTPTRRTEARRPRLLRRGAAVEDSDEAPAPRRRSRKSTDSADE